MAITIFDDVNGNWLSPSGLKVLGSLTFDADCKGVVVAIATSASAPIDVVTYGGVNLTKVADSGASARNCTVWWLDDLSGNTSGDDVEITFFSGAYVAVATAYMLKDPTGIAFVDGNGTTAAGPGPVSVPTLSGGSILIGACSNSGYYSGTLVLGGDLVLDHDYGFGFQRGKTFHDIISPTTAHASHSDTANLGIAGASFGSTVVDLTPSAFGTEVGFQAGVAFTVDADVTLLPARFGTEAGFQSGVRFGAAGPRQVMLTGNDIETPEMTTGGTEGYVLTYHEDGVPTWEPGSGPGSLALDDLSDVNAPTPNDGDVLTWDSTPGEWVALPPAGGAMALDDLTDVNAPTPSDGDALVWDNGAGEWVPGTVGGSIEVKEIDGAPDVTPVSIIRIPNGTLTDDGGGQVTLDYAASGHTHSTDWGEAADISSSAPGDAASAGATGEFADAGHVHAREAKLVGTANIIMDGGGSAIGTGVKVFGFIVDFPCTITGWTILSDINSNTTLDVWKDSYTNHPPVVGDSMVGAGTKPSLSGVRKNQSTSPNWTTLTLAAGDIVFVNVDSNSAAKWLCLSLRIRRDGSA